MKSDKHHAQNAALDAVRLAIGCARIYDEPFVRAQCEKAYGRSISRQLWGYWKKKVNAAADPDSLGGMSEATYLLLLTNAHLSRGNGKSGQVKVPRSRLAAAAQRIASEASQATIPEVCGYEALKDLIAQQTFQTYSERHYRRLGVFKRKSYSRADVQSILKNFPNHHDQQKTA